MQRTVMAGVIVALSLGTAWAGGDKNQPGQSSDQQSSDSMSTSGEQPGMMGEESTSEQPGMEHGKQAKDVEIKELRSDWNKFKDQQVKLEGQVGKTYGSDAFLLRDGEDRILVVTRSLEEKRMQQESGEQAGTSEPIVNQDDQVSLMGTVKSHTVSEIRDTYGADLTSEFRVQESESIPVVFAQPSDIQPEQSGKAGQEGKQGMKGSESQSSETQS